MAVTAILLELKLMGVGFKVAKMLRNYNSTLAAPELLKNLKVMLAGVAEKGT